MKNKQLFLMVVLSCVAGHGLHTFAAAEATPMDNLVSAYNRANIKEAQKILNTNVLSIDQAQWVLDQALSFSIGGRGRPSEEQRETVAQLIEQYIHEQLYRNIYDAVKAGNAEKTRNILRSLTERNALSLEKLKNVQSKLFQRAQVFRHPEDRQAKAEAEADNVLWQKIQELSPATPRAVARAPQERAANERFQQEWRQKEQAKNRAEFQRKAGRITK